LSNKSQVIFKNESEKFRELNKNEKLDIYEDTNQPIKTRVANLLSQLNLALGLDMKRNKNGL
jgi:hypothetical protein